jgi:hypothetical protein
LSILFPLQLQRWLYLYIVECSEATPRFNKRQRANKKIGRDDDPKESSSRPRNVTRNVIWLERDDLSSNRHPALVYCLSMISAQTRSAFVARENRFPLFRIML